ncbi:hypothetical protein EJB05_06835, partial [Eragrostis curvula]
MKKAVAVVGKHHPHPLASYYTSARGPVLISTRASPLPSFLFPPFPLLPSRFSQVVNNTRHTRQVASTTTSLSYLWL